jgi:uncharacterized protein
MLLNLKDIRTAHEHVEQVYQPGQFPPAGEDAFAVVAPVSLTFDIDKDQDQFRLVGRVRTTLELTCSRCLEPFAWAVEAPFDLRYQPHTRNTGAGEREIEADDLSTAFYENDTIDLGQLMGEQFYLSLPMKPLCREECGGLCLMCGANLNRGSCSCNRNWTDPRFAALRTFNTLKQDD